MTFDRIRAPYRFVPLPAKAAFVDQHLVGDGRAGPGDLQAAGDGFDGYQDSPFADGISGELAVEVEALTPMFIRGSVGGEGAEQRFASAPDGTPMVPGSSLRGLLRSVVELASHAKINRVHDRRYSVRDLDNAHLYRDYMAAIRPGPNGEGVLTPLVAAGWLTRKQDDHGVAAELDDDHMGTIVPCHFAKIEYGRLLGSHVLPDRVPLGRKMSAPQKYDWLGGDAERCKVHISFEVWDHDGSEITRKVRRIGDFGMATAIAPGHGGRGIDGMLVMTGQPNNWRAGDRRVKHHDFVFFPPPTPIADPPPRSPAQAPLRVTRAQLRAFEEVHADSGERHGAALGPNDEWKFWKARYIKGEAVPVFFLLNDDGRSLRAFGLAMMFRLAYKHGVGDVLERTQEGVFDAQVDLAEAIFGRVTLDAEQRRGDNRRKAGDRKLAERRNLAGRVRFGHALAQGRPQALAPVSGVLGAPKASYYPAYIAQPASAAGQLRDNAPYKTYMDDDALLAGAKRYLPQQVRCLPQPPQGNKGVAVTFRPLPAGTRFVSRVRLHNLRPHELGALLWALDFGGAEGCVHTLGMAKSAGYGRVKLRVTGAQLATQAEWPAQPWDAIPDGAAQLVTAREAFVDFMRGQAGDGWERDDTVRELRAAATPLADGDDAGATMQLHHPDPSVRNEFIAAKKARPPRALVLASGQARSRVVAGRGTIERLRAAAGGGGAAPAAHVGGGGAAPAARAGGSAVAVVAAPTLSPAERAAAFLAEIGMLRPESAALVLQSKAGAFAALPAEAKREVADAVLAVTQGWRTAAGWRNKPWYQAIWAARTR